MSTVESIDAFKSRRLRKLEDEYLAYLKRSKEFETQGKTIFAKQMDEKMDEIRRKIKELRPDPSPLMQMNQQKAPYLQSLVGTAWPEGVRYTFNFTKQPLTPEE